MYALKQKNRSLLILLLFAMLMTAMPVTVLADGVSANSDGSPGSPGASNAPGGWPPQGALPKGPFVPGGFVGTWYAFVDNTAFTLIIEQEGKIIKGAHTAIFDYGRRVDSSVGSVSLVGTVNGSLAYVEWKSGLSPESGRATLEYISGQPVTLHWRIVDDPKKLTDQTDSTTPLEVAYFLPASAFLIRK
ncbi:MAG: hypothetical protein AB9917_21015 [Negativicutes bacterium]